MQRRAFIGFLSAAVAAWPLAARAQQTGLPVVGFLGSTSSAEWASLVAGFRAGLAQAGYVDGQNVAIEFRWAENNLDRLPVLAAELIGRQPVVIVASGGTATALAAKAATQSVPIVFVIGADPVKWGLVASLNRPGANVTGVSSLVDALVSKRLELLRELVPAGTSIGLLINPKNPNFETNTKEVQDAALAFQQDVHVVAASSEADFDPAFAKLAERKVAALLVVPDPYLFGQRKLIIGRASNHALPAIYDRREAVIDGGLISYGPSVSDSNRQAGIYVARILKGAKPADLPVMQPTKFELALNLRTAKALGLVVPPTLLSRADEVIE